PFRQGVSRSVCIGCRSEHRRQLSEPDLFPSVPPSGNPPSAGHQLCRQLCEGLLRKRERSSRLVVWTLPLRPSKQTPCLPDAASNPRGNRRLTSSCPAESRRSLRKSGRTSAALAFQARPGGSHKTESGECRSS